MKFYQQELFQKDGRQFQTNTYFILAFVSIETAFK